MQITGRDKWHKHTHTRTNEFTSLTPGRPWITRSEKRLRSTSYQEHATVFNAMNMAKDLHHKYVCNQTVLLQSKAQPSREKFASLGQLNSSSNTVSFFFLSLSLSRHNPLWVCIHSPLAGFSLLFRGFQITHNDAPQSVELFRTSDQFVAETSI